MSRLGTNTYNGNSSSRRSAKGSIQQFMFPSFTVFRFVCRFYWWLLWCLNPVESHQPASRPGLVRQPDNQAVQCRSVDSCKVLPLCQFISWASRCTYATWRGSQEQRSAPGTRVCHAPDLNVSYYFDVSISNNWPLSVGFTDSRHQLWIVLIASDWVLCWPARTQWTTNGPTFKTYSYNDSGSRMFPVAGVARRSS